MGFIEGQGRNQGTLFPVALDDLVPADHVCRVIDAFVDGLKMVDLGFERAVAAQTGRPGYDPRDLLKLYLYGYLNQIRSSRRLEAECRRNVELMWLLGRLYPDHKSIAEFRREFGSFVDRERRHFHETGFPVTNLLPPLSPTDLRLAPQKRGPREKIVIDRSQGELTFEP